MPIPDDVLPRGDRIEDGRDPVDLVGQADREKIESDLALVDRLDAALPAGPSSVRAWAGHLRWQLGRSVRLTHDQRDRVERIVAETAAARVDVVTGC
jgi:hypothetical protein